MAVPAWSAAGAVAQAPPPAIGSNAGPAWSLTDGRDHLRVRSTKRTSPGASSAQVGARNGRSVLGSSNGPVAPPDGPPQACVSVCTPWNGAEPSPLT